jgi:hypothetical protein
MKTVKLIFFSAVFLGALISGVSYADNKSMCEDAAKKGFMLCANEYWGGGCGRISYPAVEMGFGLLWGKGSCGAGHSVQNECINPTVGRGRGYVYNLQPVDNEKCRV